MGNAIDEDIVAS